MAGGASERKEHLALIRDLQEVVLSPSNRLEPIALDPIADRPAYYFIVNQIGIAIVHESIL